MSGPDHQHTHEGHERGPLADASVRPARPADAPAVGLVQSVVFREAYAQVLDAAVLDTFEPQAFAAGWRTSLSQPPSAEHLLLVACAGDQVAGLAAVEPGSDPDSDAATAQLTVLAVHPDARRQGHGSRLVNAVVDSVAPRGRSRLDAWVPESDEATRAFLSRAGFRADGARRERVVSEDGRTLAEVRLTVGTERA